VPRGRATNSQILFLALHLGRVILAMLRDGQDHEIREEKDSIT